MLGPAIDSLGPLWLGGVWLNPNTIRTAATVSGYQYCKDDTANQLLEGNPGEN